jgi:hypothetical protein
MMIRTKSAEAYRQGLILCAVTFHPSPVTACTARRYGPNWPKQIANALLLCSELVTCHLSLVTARIARLAPFTFLVAVPIGFPLLGSTLHAPSSMLLSPFTSYPPRALGAPVTCHCVHRTPCSEPQMLIPPRTHRFKITVRQNSQLFQENRPFSCYDLIQADNRRLEQTCLTPLVNGNIHTSLTQPSSYSRLFPQASGRRPQAFQPVKVKLLHQA